MKPSHARYTIITGLLICLSLFQNCGKPIGKSFEGSMHSELGQSNTNLMTVRGTMNTAPEVGSVIQRITLTVAGPGMEIIEMEWIPQTPTDLPPLSYSIAVDKGVDRMVMVQVELTDSSNAQHVYFGQLNQVTVDDDNNFVDVPLEQIF